MRGLVLAGGKSTRMGSPKAEIAYHGEPEYLRSARLLESVCSEVFISTSPYWSPSSSKGNYELLADPKDASNGPLSGIASAFCKYAGDAWFVVACDLPFFDDKAVQALVQERDKQMDATCFVGYQQRPEPLCAIYEASAASLILNAALQEKQCARKVLEQMRCKRVYPSDANWVRNINETTERDSIFHESMSNVEKWVEVKYVAQLREAAGKSAEKIQTRRPTARLLYEDLARQHGFLLSHKHMRVAINDEIVEWDRPLAEHDRLMFVPPVAGG